MPEAHIEKVFEEDWNCGGSGHYTWKVMVLGKTIPFATHDEATWWCRALKLTIKESPDCGAV